MFIIFISTSLHLILRLFESAKIQLILEIMAGFSKSILFPLFTSAIIVECNYGTLDSKLPYLGGKSMGVLGRKPHGFRWLSMVVLQQNISES